MRNKDVINFKTAKPFGAEGRVQIDYTDPVTGKVKERVKGHNHVFTDSLFAAQGWFDNLSTVPLWLSDNTSEIDTDFPFLLGNPIGFGVPGEGASGTYKGNWNSASGLLKQASLDSVSFKYVYDFAPSQVTEEVKSIGLTNQYSRGRYYDAYKKIVISNLGRNYFSTAELFYNCYMYYISVGVVHKVSMITGADTTVDISATIGTSTASIGVDSSNGKFYIKVYSSTASDRKVYEYSDDTFATLANTYTVESLSDSSPYSFGVYNKMLYWPASNTLYKLDLINDLYTSSNLLARNDAIYAYDSYISGKVTTYMRAVIGKYFMCGAGVSYYQSAIIDLSTGEEVGLVSLGQSSAYAFTRHPYDTGDKAVYQYISDYSSYWYAKSALTAYKLPVDAPERPAGYGMTITYELEVTY